MFNSNFNFINKIITFELKKYKFKLLFIPSIKLQPLIKIDKQNTKKTAFKKF